MIIAWVQKPLSARTKVPVMPDASGDSSSVGDEPGEMGANLPPVGVTIISCDGRTVTVDRSGDPAAYEFTIAPNPGIAKGR